MTNAITEANAPFPGGEDTMDEQAGYRIVVRGELSERWFEWFDGLDLSFSREPGKLLTILSGPVTDQAALRGMLCKLFDLNLTLISLQRLDAGGNEEKQHE